MRAFICCGGETLKISVGGKIYRFEMHPYCGPFLLNSKGESVAKEPMEFLKAVSFWAQQGERIRDGLCVWDIPSVPITKHIGGKNYKIVGWTRERKGK